MKTIILSSTFAILGVISSTQLNAQDVAGLFHEPKAKASIKSSAPEASHKLLLNEVNIHALRDFSRQYANAENPAWFEGNAGLSVYFTMKGQKMRVQYSKRGTLEYSLKYYDESSLPAEIRQIIKSTYYDYNIMQVTEVERNGTLCYIVKMSNEKELLTIKLIDGEMEVFERIARLK